MNYAELSVAQHHRAKEFSKAQTDAMAAYCDAEHDLRELQVENAKLRELVRDMYEDIVCGCAECFFSEYDEHRGKPSECGNGGCGYRQIADRMHELGIEVDA